MAAKQVENTTLSKPLQAGMIREAMQSGAIELSEIVDVIRQGLRAMSFVREMEEEPAPGQRAKWKTLERPDIRVRMDTVKFITEHLEGLPVKRQEVISKRFTTMSEMSSMIKDSGSFRRELAAVLKEADAGELLEANEAE